MKSKIAALLVCLIITCAQLYAQEHRAGADTILARYKRYMYQSGRTGNNTMAGWVTTYSPATQWPDINYADTQRANWQLLNHLGRIDNMALGWSDPRSVNFHDSAWWRVINQALDYWLDKRYHNSNWWQNEIGVPQLMRDILVLLRDTLSPARFAGGLQVLGQYRLQPAGAGANLAWSADLGLHYGALAGNDSLIRQCTDRLEDEIRITTKDGVQPDYSFHQHGARLQMYQYGSAYLNQNVRLAWQLRNTPWAYPEEKIKLLTAFVLEGWQWMCRGINTVPGTIDRSVSRPDALRNADMRNLVPYLCELDPSKTTDLLALAARQDGRGGSLQGFRNFPYSDFSAYQDRRFSFFVKTISNRTLASEDINSENLKGQLLNSGDAYIIRNGDEYFNLMPVWDWSKLPGITSFVSASKIISHPFTGGVTDSISGLTVMDYELKGPGEHGDHSTPVQAPGSHSITARKYWACHDGTVVCLIANLRKSDPGEQVYTVLDQCRWKGDITVDQPGHVIGEGDQVLGGVQWIHHSGLAYIFLQPSGVSLHAGKDTGSWYAINRSQPAASLTGQVFMPVMNCPSGTGPFSFGYVLTACGNPGQVSSLVKAPSWKILRNDSSCQAVSFRDGVVLCAFYAKGSLKLDDRRTMSVDAPCLILLSGKKIYASNPAQTAGEVMVTINNKSWRLQLPKDGTTVAAGEDFAGGRGETSAATPLCQPVYLRCEYLQSPLGLDVPQPRLSWRLEDKRPGALQMAYAIAVGTDSLALTWSSGRRNSPDQLVTYDGPALQPFTRYYWRVEVWDKDGQRSAGQIASFETGMMDMANWKGAWISDSRNRDLRRAPYFRKIFQASKKIRSARAYIAAAGLYELYINGEKIGDHRLDPMYTRFDRRNLYVTYDVTGSLRSGDNAVGVLLGNGWYNHQSTAVWYFHEASWRSRPSFCMDLRITYEDGSVETLSSGKDWKTALSPIVLNSIYTGEHVDHRLESAGWNTTGFNDSAWKEVIYRPAPSHLLLAQAMHPIRNVEEVRPVSLTRIKDSVWVFNLGRNIAGVSRLRIQGPAGTKLTLKHGERLYPDGRVDQSNISVHYRPTDDTDPFGTDIYILNGKGEEEFMPKFNYKGFQYVEITATPANPGPAPVLDITKESLTAFFMHSDVPSVGAISSSNPVIDKIWKATNNSYLSNLFGYPTDCPQREKNGWTGDAHIAVETGLYNFDGITIYEKWLADHRDEQEPNGVLPSIIPTGGWGYEWGNGPDWTSTIALIPWNIYLFYGDKKLLADCYDNIRRYVDHISDISPTGLTTWGLGDWIPVTTKPPVIFTSSVYYYTDAYILTRAAALLGKEEDRKKYTALAEKIKNAFNEKFLDRATGIYGKGMQTELSMPLCWGLVPDEMKSKVAANLAAKVVTDGYHLNVGLLGTKALLNALSENGYADVAYRVASSETFPSWGWWIVNGATTLYENWPIDAKSDISLNHIMFGEIGAWMYKGLAGILPDATAPGFKHIFLRPHFVRGLDHFEASHEGPYGTIRSSWKKERGKIVYAVIIPPNTTATLELPGQALRELSAGDYSFRVEGQK